MELGDWDTITSIIANSVTALTAVVLVVVAIKGLQAWRQQMVGQSRYDVARRVLLLARRFRGEFGRSRGMFSYAGESADRPREESETSEQKHVLDEQYARLKRLRPAADVLLELEQAVWEAEVVTGEDLIPLAKPFGEVIRELNIAIAQHFDARLRTVNRQFIPADMQDRHTKLIYEPGEDELTQKVDEALANLEKRLKKYIR